MRISDWSSDVCSSDLRGRRHALYAPLVQPPEVPNISLMELSDEQIDRYARHLVLPEIGEEGQEKLLNARVLVIGAGGLGSPLLLYLAAAGVGSPGIVDDDTGRAEERGGGKEWVSKWRSRW